MHGLRKFCLAAICLLPLSPAVTSAQDDKPRRKDLVENLNEPETFGTTARFLGAINSGFVVLHPTCVFAPGDELGPEDRCILLNPNPAVANLYDESDLGRVTLPANSVKSLIYVLPNHTVSYQFWNTTVFPAPNAVFNYQPYITIESAALNDPSLLNPLSDPPNQPFNGKLDLILGARRTIDRSLAAGERAAETLNYTRGFAMNKTFFRQFNLPDRVIDRLLREQMTIRLNIRGRVRYVSDGFVVYSFRILGN